MTDALKKGFLSQEDKARLLSFFDEEGKLIDGVALSQFLKEMLEEYPPQMDEYGRFRCIVCGTIHQDTDICDTCKQDFFQNKRMRSNRRKRSKKNEAGNSYVCISCGKTVDRVIREKCWACYRKRYEKRGKNRIPVEVGVASDIFEHFDYGFFSDGNVSEETKKVYKKVLQGLERNMSSESTVFEKHDFGFFPKMKS